jgi:protein TonB
VHAKAIQAPKPPYPEKSRRRGEEGTVRLKVQVLPSGSVGEIEVVTSPGFADLEQAAIECVRQEWKFTPATLDGKPVEDRLSIRFIFRQE